MNLEQYNNWEKFREKKTTTVTGKEFEMIARYYADVFNRKYWKPPCTSCNKKKYQQWINELNNHWISIEKPTK